MREFLLFPAFVFHLSFTDFAFCLTLRTMCDLSVGEGLLFLFSVLYSVHVLLFLFLHTILHTVFVFCA